MTELLHSSDVCSHTDGIINLTNPDDARDMLYGATDRFLLIVVIPIFSMIGIVGNVAFLFMAIRIPDLNYVTTFLSHLAVCDILFLISVNVWFVIIVLNTQVNTEFPVYSTFECAISVISVNWWYFTSLGLITLISAERYVAICHPVKHRNIKGKARTLKLLAVIWISAFFITLTQAPQNGKFTIFCLLWPELEEFDKLPRTIKDCEPVNVVADIYGSSVALVSLILTLVINVVLFYKIIKQLRMHTAGTSADQARHQVTRTLIANGIIFFLCQLPYRVWVLDDVLDLTEKVDLIGPELESLLLVVGRGFLILNSTVNPYLYVATCRHYRQAMMKAFCSHRCLRDSTSVEESGQSGSRGTMDTVAIGSISSLKCDLNAQIKP